MKSSKQPSSRIGLLILIFVAFIALGMPDGLLGVGWPSIRDGFKISQSYLGWFLFASTTGYLISSFANGFIVSRIGIGKLLAISCFLTGGALIGNTLVPVWWMMVLLGIFLGLGAGAIDAGLNSYVADNFSEKVMQWLHASYGIGLTCGPIIMTLSITYLSSWRYGYRIVGGFQLLLALIFILTLATWNIKLPQNKPEGTKKLVEYKTSYAETLRRPAVWLSLLIFFCYVAVEGTLGSWTYTLLTESRHINAEIAGFWASSYCAAFTIGRILAGTYAKRIRPNVIVRWSILSAILGVVLLLINVADWLSIVGICVIGLSIAPIFGSLVTETSERVGDRYALNTIGMQMSASVLGGVSIPSLAGILAQRISLEIIPILLLILLTILFGFYSLSLKLRKAQQVKAEVSS